MMSRDLLRRCLWMMMAAVAVALLPTAASAASWTVMVYLNADNDLDPYGVMDLNEMEAAPGNAAVNVVVQIDRSSLSAWSDTRRYLVTPDSNMNTIGSTLLESLGEKDMGNPQTLIDFVDWAHQNYPADHYLLVLWDHGSGWKASGLKQIPWKGISYDYGSGNDISTTELGVALRQITTDIGRKLDIVATDACLMGMAEVAYEAKDGANYWVSSEETIPGYGYDYKKVLTDLDATPTMSAVQLCQAMVQDYCASYDEGGSQTDGWGAIPVCLSAVDLAKMDAVEAAVDTFAVAAQNAMPTYCASLLPALVTSQSYWDWDYRDLYDLASRVKAGVPDTGLQGAADGVLAAVSAAVIANGYVGSWESGSHGLSIYYPEWRAYMAEYATLAFTASTGDHWATFISTEPPCTGGTDDAYEPDNTPAEATTLISGHTQAMHWFSASDDVDWAVITMQPGTPYVMQTQNLGPMCDTVLFLFGSDAPTHPDIVSNPDAYDLAHNDDIDLAQGNFASRIVYNPLSSGTYYLMTMEWAGDYGVDTAYDLFFSQVSFLDVPEDHWAFSAIQSCVSANIVQGYEGFMYAPSDPVTRAAMAVFMARSVAGGDGNVPDGPATATFTDVPNTGYGVNGTDPYWAYKYIEYAKARGIVQGYTLTQYSPETVVDRGQMAAFIARAIVNPVGDVGLAGYLPPAAPSFPDVTASNDWAWAYRYVEYIVKQQVVQGYDDLKYHPEYQVTRDQMAVYIWRAFHVGE